jgi:branched-chain amino acid transport system substrate-binding protein
VPAGLDGVCNPSTWTETDHRAILKVDLYRAKVSGATDPALAELIKDGRIGLEKVTTIELPRKPEWQGW